MDAAAQLTLKSHLCGTHRAVAPSVTWERIAPWLGRFGITRIAPVTGLDIVGIPTVMAIRPASRGLSVAQGKGLDPTAARVSGAMEAIEHAIAESIAGDRLYGSVDELGARYRIAQIDRIAAALGPLPRATPILWMKASELVAGGSALCPYELVHLDLRLPQPPGSGYFAVGSNGLASGNTLVEATCHALFEVVERDATARFYAMSAEQQSTLRLHAGSVGDPSCRALLERYARSEVDVAIWEITSPLGVPAFLCDVVDRPVHALRGLQRARGVGCHSAREIALSRALCEAAQSRLTHIAGSRDDIAPSELDRARRPEALEHARLQLSGEGSRAFDAGPDQRFESFEAELTWLVSLLGAHGYGEVLRIPLGDDPALPFAVVRVVVPGLLASDHSRAHAGAA